MFETIHLAKRHSSLHKKPELLGVHQSPELQISNTGKNINLWYFSLLTIIEHILISLLSFKWCRSCTQADVLTENKTNILKNTSNHSKITVTFLLPCKIISMLTILELHLDTILLNSWVWDAIPKKTSYKIQHKTVIFRKSMYQNSSRSTST